MYRAVSEIKDAGKQTDKLITNFFHAIFQNNT